MIGALYLGTVAIGTWIASPAGVLFAEGILTFLTGIGVALLNTFANASVIQKCDKRYLTRLSGLMGSASAVAAPVASVLVSAVVGFISIADLCAADPDFDCCGAEVCKKIAEQVLGRLYRTG